MMDEEIFTCVIKDGKLDCTPLIDGSEVTIPSLPIKIAWTITVIALLLTMIGTVFNHLAWSITAPVFVFPFFGGIPIPRDTLFDVSLFLLVGSPIVIAIAWGFVAKKRTRIVIS